MQLWPLPLVHDEMHVESSQQAADAHESPPHPFSNLIIPSTGPACVEAGIEKEACADRAPSHELMSSSKADGPLIAYDTEPVCAANLPVPTSTSAISLLAFFEKRVT